MLTPKGIIAADSVKLAVLLKMPVPDKFAGMFPAPDVGPSSVFTAGRTESTRLRSDHKLLNGLQVPLKWVGIPNRPFRRLLSEPSVEVEKLSLAQPLHSV